MKSALAVLAGWASMTVLVIVATALVAWTGWADGAGPTPAYLAVNLLYSAAFAALGGWVTARLAPRGARVHALILAGIVAALGSVSAAAGPSLPGQPAWYGWTVTLLGACGVLAGGEAASRRAGAGSAARGRA